MRAAFITRPEHVEIGEAASPAPADHDAEVVVLACGVCGSNLHDWRHPEQSIHSSGSAYPGAAGHEVVGVVRAAASDGSSPATGTRVVVEPNMSGACGACEACREGAFWFCRARRLIPNWGFAERMTVSGASLFPVPDGVSDGAATLVEPLACGLHALRSSWTATRREGRLSGARIAVLGAGVAGLLAVAAAKHLGAGHVVAVARYPHQAERARALGADEVLASDAADLDARLRAADAHLVVEAVGGTAATFELALRTVRRGGEVAVLGLFDEPQTVDTRRAVYRELRLYFPVTYGIVDGVHDFDVALDVLAGRPEPFDGLISHRFALAEVNRAFAAAADKRQAALRVVVVP